MCWSRGVTRWCRFSLSVADSFEGIRWDIPIFNSQIRSRSFAAGLNRYDKGKVDQFTDIAPSETK